METVKKQDLRKLVTVTSVVDKDDIKEVGDDLFKVIQVARMQWMKEFPTTNGALPERQEESLRRLALLQEALNNMRYGVPELCKKDKMLWEQAEEEKDAEARAKKKKADEVALAKATDALTKLVKKLGIEGVDPSKTNFIPEGFLKFSLTEKKAWIKQINALIYPSGFGLYVLRSGHTVLPPQFVPMAYLGPTSSGCDCDSCRYAAIPVSHRKFLYSSFMDALGDAMIAAAAQTQVA